VSETRATGEGSGWARADAGTSPDDDSDLDLHVAADKALIPGLRRSASAWLQPHHLGESDLGAVLVVISELAANAIEASQPDEQVDIHLDCADHRVLVEVRNRSRRTEPVPIPAMADPLAPRGRGLAIVSSLTERLTLDEVDGDTVAIGVLALGAGGD
jgi:anti-sigma regulatory factor (Ser/Thr protein kinase)